MKKGILFELVKMTTFSEKAFVPPRQCSFLIVLGEIYILNMALHDYHEHGEFEQKCEVIRLKLLIQSCRASGINHAEAVGVSCIALI